MVRSVISFQVPHHKSECPFYRTVQFSKGKESADLYPASSLVHGDFSITELPVSSILSVRHRIDSSSSPLGSFEHRRSHLNQITVQIIKTNYFLSPTVHHEAINILNRRILCFQFFNKCFHILFLKI